MKEHDPLERQHDDEPRFVILARDPLSDGIVALWAALRARHIYKVKDIVANLVVIAGKQTYSPDSNTEHVISAQQVSNKMIDWRYANRPKAPTNARSVELEIPDNNEVEALTQNTNLTPATS